MFKPNTLFVIGAGASHEISLPLGHQLVEDVAALLTKFKRDELTGRLPEHDPFVRSMMNYAGPEKTPQYVKAAWQMIGGMRSAGSVDRYIDRFRTEEYIRTLGKAAIVQIIASKEQRSALISDKGQPLGGGSAFDKTWYFPFVQMLLEGSPPLEELFRDIAIVCFNYDRCIEHYLACELMRSYSIGRELAAKLVKRLDIWHPYGTIAPLDAHDVHGIGYGDAEAIASRCFHYAERITTFTEEHKDGEMINAIRDRIKTSETVVFLGFGYYKQNLALIAPDGPTKIKRVLGTGFGLSDSDRNVVVGEMLQPWHKSSSDIVLVEVQYMKCAELLNHYRMELSA